MDAQDAVLDYVFDLRAKIADLISPEAPESFNRPNHGLGKAEVVATLIELASANLVWFRDTNSRLSMKYFDRAGIEDQWIVSLTKLGGQRWERIFQPEWQKYISIQCSFCENRPVASVTVESGSKDRLLAMLSTLQAPIVSGAESQIIGLQPWHPVYWKTVNIGFLVRLEYPEELIDILSVITSKNKWRNTWAFTDKEYQIFTL